MNTIKFDKKNVQVVAHRGLSGLEPENSIPAFVAAGNRSYFGIETDIHVTKDGKFIVIHDETTTRVAGDNINVEECTFDFARKVVLDNICKIERDSNVKIGDLKGRTDLLLPRLEDYINICKKYEKKAVLEVKNRMQPEILANLVEEIKGLDFLENVIFISFSLENMIELRKLLPNQKLQYLTCEFNDDVHHALKEYHLDFDVHYSVLRKDCWTVDKKEDAERLADWGVDFITTNILE